MDKERAAQKLAVGRNAISSGLLKSEVMIKQLPKLALRSCDLKLVENDNQSKNRAKTAKDWFHYTGCGEFPLFLQARFTHYILHVGPRPRAQALREFIPEDKSALD